MVEVVAVAVQSADYGFMHSRLVCTISPLVASCRQQLCCLLSSTRQDDTLLVLLHTCALTGLWVLLHNILRLIAKILDPDTCTALLPLVVAITTIALIDILGFLAWQLTQCWYRLGCHYQSKWVLMSCAASRRKSHCQ